MLAEPGLYGVPRASNLGKTGSESSWSLGHFPLGAPQVGVIGALCLGWTTVVLTLLRLLQGATALVPVFESLPLGLIE